MIRSYRDKDTEATARGERARRIPSDITARARVMIRRVANANGGYVSVGPTGTPTMSKSPITTEDRLPNPYPGEGLREDLFDAGGVTIAETALATGLSVEAINGFLDGAMRVDADFDLRLGRYFGFSPGYFLRLQIAYDLEEVERSAGDEIDRIRPHTWQAA